MGRNTLNKPLCTTILLHDRIEKPSHCCLLEGRWKS